MAPRHRVLLAAALLAVGRSLVYAQAPAETLKETKSSKDSPPHEIVVAGAEPVAINEKEWAPLPDYLRGASLLRPAKGNELSLTVRQQVEVLMAASWNYDGNIGGGWLETRTSPAQLAEQGWEQVGTINYKGNDAHLLLRRSLKAGDVLKLHTRKNGPPAIIIPAADRREAVAALPARRPTSNNLSAIRPPDSGAKNAGGPAVRLRAHEPDIEDRFVERGILLRELVRQAILLAAREELGLPTRDESLRETMGQAGQAGPLPLEPVVRVQENGRVAVTLFRFKDGEPEILWDDEFSLTGDDAILSLAEIAQRLSRAALVTALKKAGFDGQANPIAEASAAAAESIEPTRSELHLIPQFALARQLHGLLRTRGESPERLAALAQVYAHLGVLSEHFWSPAHKVFKARGLLYAERAAAGWPDSAAAFYGRGYARALAGLHQAALDDLAAADKLAPGGGQPTWKPAIESLCRFELDKLDALAQASDGLPRLLRLMANERYGGTRQILDSAESLLELVPDSDRAIDTIYETRHLGTRGEAAALFSERIGERLYPRLGQITDLPPATKRVVASEIAARQGGFDESEERKRRLEAMRSLREAGNADSDRGEPSWDALAALVQETAFISAERQVEFLGRSLSVEADDSIRNVEPLIADHLLRPFVESHTSDRRLRQQKLQELVGVYRPQDLTLIEQFMVDYIEGHAIRLYFRVTALPMAHQDHVYRDLLQNARRTRELFWRTYASELRRVSPHSPLTIATSAEYDWQYAAPLAAEWEERYRQSPQVQAALGRQYLRQEKYGDAARCLAQAAKLMPEYNIYEPLARAWLKQKNEEKWQKTWDEYLEQEDFGLAHERARVNVAEHFMQQAQWDKALPYAEAAAASGAQWTLECAGDCLTGLGRYDEAEAYFRASAERYVESSPSWFFWCRRTGRGDRQAARAFVRDAMDNQFVAVNLIYKLSFLALDGDKEAALAGYRESLARNNSPMFAWMAALLADELKQPQVRDESLQQARRSANDERYKRPFLGEAAALAQDARSNPAKMNALPAKANALVAKIEDPREAAVVAYVLGKLLDLHGQDSGIELLKRAARLPFTQAQAAMAAAELRDRNIQIDEN